MLILLQPQAPPWMHQIGLVFGQAWLEDDREWPSASDLVLPYAFLRAIFPSFGIAVASTDVDPDEADQDVELIVPCCFMTFHSHCIFCSHLFLPYSNYAAKALMASKGHGQDTETPVPPDIHH